MRITIAYTSTLLVAALFFVAAVNGYTPHAGVGLTVNNPFLKNTSNKFLPMIYEYLRKMIQPPNSIRYS